MTYVTSDIWEEPLVEKTFMSIDPGISTGFVVAHDGVLAGSGVIRTPHNDVVQLINLLVYWQPNMIVIEDFILRSRRKSRDHADTCKNIGVVMGFATLQGLHMEFQTPGYRRAFVDIAKAIAPTNTSVHTIDAFAHALAWHKANQELLCDVKDTVRSTVYSCPGVNDVAIPRSAWDVQLLMDH